jgi:hypothetical protein
MVEVFRNSVSAKIAHGNATVSLGKPKWAPIQMVAKYHEHNKYIGKANFGGNTNRPRASYHQLEVKNQQMDNNHLLFILISFHKHAGFSVFSSLLIIAANSDLSLVCSHNHQEVASFFSSIFFL